MEYNNNLSVVELNIMFGLGTSFSQESFFQAYPSGIFPITFAHNEVLDYN